MNIENIKFGPILQNTICFDEGMLYFEEDKFHFKGDADKSAKCFLEKVDAEYRRMLSMRDALGNLVDISQNLSKQRVIEEINHILENTQ